MVAAHCLCIAGNGEACPHIAAIMSYIECGIPVRAEHSCTDKESSWLPEHIKSSECGLSPRWTLTPSTNAKLSELYIPAVRTCTGGNLSILYDRKAVDKSLPVLADHCARCMSAQTLQAQEFFRTMQPPSRNPVC
ncbi:hypothetical protein HPB48_026245 [Haemaphysalis longicornis]|uniref:SWIM-type domain-containing protein n=1 Tax=Haemaphysalis longicornis TaxID=44386 RepID=A0A9J6HAA9_HAELO|nr:hypothetical protein HPB48_026245 [Haemaphysalis longicornis]